VIAVRLLRDGAVVREVVFKQLPVTLGRAAECELPLFDPSVSRRHAALERSETGELVLRDLGSRNGIYAGAGRVPAVPVGAFLHCLVGNVELEIQPLDDAATQEVLIREPGLERRRGVKFHVRSMLIGVSGWLCAVVIEPSFWSPWEKERAVSVAGQAIAALIALPLFAVFLLILLRAFARRVRLADTLQALARLLWLPPLASAFGLLAYYALSPAALAQARSVVGGCALALSVASLAAVRRPQPRTLFMSFWAVATLLIFWGISATGSLRAQKAGQPNLDFHVQLPLGGWAGRAESMDEYVAQLTALSAEAAKQASATRAKRDD
jgi:hypothetical protein